MPLFGKSPKSPAEVVRTTREDLIALERGEAKKPEKVLDELAKMIGHMKSMACRSVQDQIEPNTEIVAQLAQEMYNQNLIIVLLANMQRLDFESKKDVVAIYNSILRRQIGTRNPTVEYICTKPELLFMLVRGYERPDVALNCGNMLRESIRFEPLAKLVLYSEHFDGFFQYVEGSAFDIASDAFTTFKELLTRHKVVVAEYLDANYEKFFDQYQKLLISENYVTRRQSLKLLGELLLDRHNFNVMTRYISNPENLKLMMNMLREKSRNIQFEAFHVFKVFVANPNKQKPIVDILIRNRDRLVEFLTKFHSDRQDDEQFNDEKAYLIKQIRDMKPAPGTFGIVGASDAGVGESGSPAVITSSDGAAPVSLSGGTSNFSMAAGGAGHVGTISSSPVNSSSAIGQQARP